MGAHGECGFSLISQVSRVRNVQKVKLHETWMFEACSLSLYLSLTLVHRYAHACPRSISYSLVIVTQNDFRQAWMYNISYLLTYVWIFVEHESRTDAVDTFTSTQTAHGTTTFRISVILNSTKHCAFKTIPLINHDSSEESFTEIFFGKSFLKQKSNVLKNIKIRNEHWSYNFYLILIWF